MSQSNHQRYWQANTALIRNLLIVWGLVSIVFSILLVQPLNAIRLGSLPLGFWMAQQGSIYIFVVLIFIYAVKMDQLDRQYLRRTQLDVNSQSQADSQPPQEEAQP